MVNTASWYNFCYRAEPYGLQHVGSEENLGADGIANTPDDGIPYLDTNGDGEADSAWYDSDEDGIVDGCYDYETEIEMTDARIEQIDRYPTHGGKKGDKHFNDYNHVSNDHIDLLEGVFYTNHALASRSRRHPQHINGAVISKDEAIMFNMGFNSRLRFCYDSRIHSRYRRVLIEDYPLNLPLPVADEVSVLDRYEIPPMRIQPY
jgi:hypothetical protein